MTKLTRKLLEAQLRSALDEAAMLKQQAKKRDREVDELRVQLRNSESEGRHLKHELMSMQSSNEHAIAVHRDAINLLLDHHNYQPRSIEWVDEKGKRIGVQLSPVARHAIFGHADAAQTQLTDEEKAAYGD